MQHTYMDRRRPRRPCRERSQSFSQPTSLITCIWRQRSNWDKLDKLHVILLRKTKHLMVLVFVEHKGAYCCLSGWRAGHSKIMCISSATATSPQCVHTLATCWPPAKRPTIKSKVQKALHTSTRNRWLTKLPTLATRLKPIMVCACNNPSNAGHSHKCRPNAYARLSQLYPCP